MVLSRCRRGLVMSVIAVSLVVSQASYAANPAAVDNQRHNSWLTSILIALTSFFAGYTTKYFVGRQHPAANSVAPCPVPDNPKLRPAAGPGTQASKTPVTAPEPNGKEDPVQDQGSEATNLKQIVLDDSLNPPAHPNNIPSPSSANHTACNAGRNVTDNATSNVTLSVVTKEATLAFAKLPEVKTPMRLIGTTNLGEHKQVLDYVIENKGFQQLQGLRVSGYSRPIRRDHTIANNCGPTLAAGASCAIRLTVSPSIARDISQALTVIAKDPTAKGSQEQKISTPITIAVTYEPYWLITKDMVKLDAIVLMSIPEVETFNNLTHQELAELFVKYGDLPILIKCQDKFALFGIAKECFDGYLKLKLTKFYNLGNCQDIYKVNYQEDVYNVLKELPFVEQGITVLKKNDPCLTAKVVEILKIGHDKFNPNSEERELKFTTPLVIHEIDENVRIDALFAGTDRGLLKYSKNNDMLNWSLLDEAKYDQYVGYRVSIEDVHIVGSHIYEAAIHWEYREDIRPVGWDEVWRTIRYTPDYGKNWHIKGYKVKVRGIRKIGDELLAVCNNGLKKVDIQTQLQGVNIYFYEAVPQSKIKRKRNYQGNNHDPSLCDVASGNSNIDDRLPCIATKVHGDSKNICVATKKHGLFVRDNITKEWRTYNEKIPGFIFSEMLAVHCDQHNLYVGTDKGLSISEDNGATWRSYLDGYKISGIYAKDKNVWVATEKELFFSPDNGQSWTSQHLVLGDYALIFFPVTKRQLEQQETTTAEELQQEMKDEQGLAAPALIDAILSKPKDAYRRILGVPSGEQDCTVIAEAARKRITMVHPDKNRDNQKKAAEAFKMVIKARDSLNEELECGRATK